MEIHSSSCLAICAPASESFPICAPANDSFPTCAPRSPSILIPARRVQNQFQSTPQLSLSWDNYRESPSFSISVVWSVTFHYLAAGQDSRGKPYLVRLTLGYWITVIQILSRFLEQILKKKLIKLLPLDHLNYL